MCLWVMQCVSVGDAVGDAVLSPVVACVSVGDAVLSPVVACVSVGDAVLSPVVACVCR